MVELESATDAVVWVQDVSNLEGLRQSISRNLVHGDLKSWSREQYVVFSDYFYIDITEGWAQGFLL
jgi:hypothetical protein